MKIIVYTIGLLLIVSLYSCNNSNTQTGGEYNITNPSTANGDGENNNLPAIEFTETEYNFGTVIQGEKVAHSFVFKNTGNGNLIISNVKASCGCTVPKWSKEPIKPGQTGNVEIVFDSANRDGIQTKSAKVYSNTQPNITELIIRCEVIM
ncbi:MAG: DUF1573 domain-containing protein [Bacteroidales bacterium]|nr:DUF1573 domain-containing protein [Bacteroidales bacterium]MDD3859833.1 DUF1573 domain-containing protein [Bacteroidales bacterium]